MQTPRHIPPRRFLVMGGAGFIGHRTVNNLIARPDVEVAILDNLSVGIPMPAERPRLITHEVDIRDKDRVSAIVREFRPDTIVHLAAVHHIPTCESRRAYSLEVNVIGTEYLLEIAEVNKIGRFVLASSGAVYGWRDGALTESGCSLEAADNYSLAKRTNEQQVTFWAARTGGYARIARIFNTIGHDDPNAHLIPDIISQIPQEATRAEVALGNLTPRRDYIHADDTARAIATIACETGGPDIDIYNVSSGTEVSVAEVVTMLGDVMGIAIAVREDSARKRRVDRPSQLGSTDKIRTRLDFVPQKSLRIALEDIVRHSGRVLR